MSSLNSHDTPPEYRDYTLKATEFFRRKGIIEPENVFIRATRDAKTLDRLKRVLDGDIVTNKTSFVEQFTLFCSRVQGWEASLASLQKIFLEDSKEGGQLQLSKKPRTGSQSSISISEEIEDRAEVHQNFIWKQFLDSLDIDKDKINNILVIRQQNGGYCYLHAPVVLEHYLISISTNGTNCGMINIGTYESNILTGDEIQTFIFEPCGGSSLDMLMNICGLKDYDIRSLILPRPFDSDFKLLCEEIFQKVDEKPFLVSMFKVYPHFTLSNKFSYVDEDFIEEEKVSGHHSMLIIGARKTVDTYFYLLQNWWENKFFVEVSAEYLRRCRPVIHFVEKVIVRTQNLPTYISPYAETSLDNLGEQLYEENCY